MMFKKIKIDTTSTIAISIWNINLVVIDKNPKKLVVKIFGKTVCDINRIDTSNESLDIKFPATYVTPPMLQDEVNKTQTLKNKFLGEKCIIIGGSPSIKKLDLSKIHNGYKIMTCNKGYLLKDEKLKRSDFHFITDGNFIPENQKMLHDNEAFFNSFILSTDCDTTLLDSNKCNYYKTQFIAWDDSLGYKFPVDKNQGSFLYSAHTVVTTMLQFAWYMGFKEIIMIGVDLSFSLGKNHFYMSSDLEKKRVVRHSLKYQSTMYKGIEEVYNMLTNEGVKVVNASPNVDSLKFIPKKDYNMIFK